MFCNPKRDWWLVLDPFVSYNLVNKEELGKKDKEILTFLKTF